jgi:hypothetical protein
MLLGMKGLGACAPDETAPFPPQLPVAHFLHRSLSFRALPGGPRDSKNSQINRLTIHHETCDIANLAEYRRLPLYTQSAFFHYDFLLLELAVLLFKGLEEVSSDTTQ